MEVQSKVLARLLKKSKIDENVLQTAGFIDLIKKIDDTVIELKDQVDRTVTMVEKSNEEISRYLSDIDSKNKIIAEKNADLLAIYQNLPQGILIIDQNLVIMENFSPSISEIFFDYKDFANKNVMELLFEKTNLSKNALDQAQQSLFCSFDAPSVAFHLNEHSLPRKVTRHSSDQPQFLEIDWCPIETDGSVKKIMIVIKDSSNIVRMEAETKAQKRDLEMIGEIITCGSERSETFLESTYTLLSFCQELVSQNKPLTPEKINSLFRNLHTIKGNARQFGFTQVTEHAHQTEQICAELKKSQNNLDIIPKIKNDLDTIDLILDGYQGLFLKIYQGNLKSGENIFYKFFGQEFAKYYQ